MLRVRPQNFNMGGCWIFGARGQQILLVRKGPAVSDELEPDNGHILAQGSLSHLKGPDMDVIMQNVTAPRAVVVRHLGHQLRQTCRHMRTVLLHYVVDRLRAFQGQGICSQSDSSRVGIPVYPIAIRCL